MVSSSLSLLIASAIFATPTPVKSVQAAAQCQEMTPELQREINEAAGQAHALEVQEFEKLGLQILMGQYSVTQHQPGPELQALLKDPSFVVIDSVPDWPAFFRRPYRHPTLAHDTQGNLYKIEYPPASRSIGICVPCKAGRGTLSALQSQTVVLKVPEGMTWKGIKKLTYASPKIKTREVKPLNCLPVP